MSSLAERKAYYVTVVGDSWGTVAFGRTEGEAKSKAMCELNYDYTDLRTVRREKYDQYAIRGRVPKRILFHDGWEFACCRCGRTVQKDIGGVIRGDKPFCPQCDEVI